MARFVELKKSHESAGKIIKENKKDLLEKLQKELLDFKVELNAINTFLLASI
jgi:hypothetical protein